MALDHPSAVEEKDGGALLAAAEHALAGSKNALPKEFVEALLGSAPPEDLLRYEARDAAVLSEAAWAFLAERTLEAPQVRIVTPDRAPSSDQLKQVSVLEIINDDMPFLLDSVLGELSERGIEIRLVAHPIISVERNTAGRLTAFRASLGAGTLRESFIHVHMERIEEETRRGTLVQAIEQ